MIALYKQFSQGVSVAICAVISASTLGYMILDSHKMEKKKIKDDYGKQIMVLNDEIRKLKIENPQN